MMTGGDVAASVGVKQSAAASKRRERLANTFLDCMTTFLGLHCRFTFTAHQVCKVIDCKTRDRVGVLSQLGHICTSGACCNTLLYSHSDAAHQYFHIPGP